MESTQSRREVRMYAKPGDIDCPVASLDIYLSKLSPKCDVFFQAHFCIPKLMYGIMQIKP